MSRWPRWLLDGEPAGLAKYLQPDAVKALMALPGPSGAPVLVRLRDIFEAFQARGIRYAWEEPSDEPGRQVIRPPGQVLSAPRHATCLDLAVTFASGCLAAGLRPMIVMVEPPALAAMHAVVAVWLARHQPYPLDRDVYRQAPAGLVDELQAGQTGPPGQFVVVDVVGVTQRQERCPTRGLGASFDEALGNGARYLTSGEWSWRLGVDIHSAWRERDRLAVGHQPDDPPLRRAYLDPADAPSPLRLLRADYEVVAFQSRDELTILDDRCRAPLARPAVKVALIHGVGGAGKTRLAAELTKGLAADGWYGGMLRANATDAEIAWLGVVESPLVVVVDYAEARPAQHASLFKALRGRVDLPTVVVATARTLTGWWEVLGDQLANDDLPYQVIDTVALAGQPPDPARVFQAALRAFGGGSTGAVPGGPPGGGWTTLDYVLLAWMAAQRTDSLPATRGELYCAVLVHERSYWAKTFGGDIQDRPEPHVFEAAAVCLTVTQATSDRADTLLQAVPALARDGAGLNKMARTMRTCLREPDGRMSLRPDPVADHLVLDVFKRGAEELRDRLLGITADHERLAFVQIMNRAGFSDPATAIDLLQGAGRRDPSLVNVILEVATVQAGAALVALEALAADPEVVLPEGFAQQVPDRHFVFRRLLWQLAERALAAARTDASTPTEALARILDHAATKASQAGQRACGLTLASEAAQRYRALAEASPAAFLPALATSLTNLSSRQRDNGDWVGALASITEAVQLRPAMAQESPFARPGLVEALLELASQQSRNGDRVGGLASISEAVQLRRAMAESAFVFDLAWLLGHLSLRQSENGDRVGALASISEAVQLRRAMAEVSPEALGPDLAGLLSNLSLQQSYNGDPVGALASITEAVQLYRAFAEVSPEAFGPDLAMSLNNLSIHQSANGDPVGALASITEAVHLRRAMAHALPAAFGPDLAQALNNFSLRQSENGDSVGALASITEAVQLYRGFAEALPEAFGPHLALSLNNFSLRQSENGDSVGALASITEAVQLYRGFAEALPAAFGPDLARSLRNLSLRQSENGDRVGAFASITEAVQLCRGFAEALPSAFGPDLARSLRNLSLRQSENGDRVGALASITEAVQLCRGLAEALPSAFGPDLARSLTDLSNRQSATGDRVGALASITEAVELCRGLAEALPAAFGPDLAASLSDLSNHQSDNGDLVGALASITESVELYRAVAEASPAASGPALAGSLNNLSNRQADNGDPVGALASITEAVQLYRASTEALPAAFGPDLAGSLNDLSNHQSDNGDPVGALASITEAVQLYRAVAEALPAAFGPDLARSLHNLADRTADLDSPNAGMHAATAVIDTLSRPAVRADLRANIACWSIERGLFIAASEQIVIAVHEATEGDDDLAGAARRRLRTATSELAQKHQPPSELPRWATAHIDEPSLEVIIRWANSLTWETEKVVIRAEQALVASETLREALDVLENVNPGHPELSRIRTRITMIDELGVDAALSLLENTYRTTSTLEAWLATTTWEDSKQYFVDHHEVLSSSEVADLLAEDPNDSEALCHLGLLDLARELGTDTAYESVTNPNTNEALVDNAIRGANSQLLHALLRAVPDLDRHPLAGNLATGGLALLNDNLDDARTHIQAVAGAASPIRRQAIAVHLRALASTQPRYQKGALELAAILEQSST